MAALTEGIKTPLSFFIEIDTGYGRTGIKPEDLSQISEFINQSKSNDKLKFRGFYVHNGHTYKANSQEEINEIHIGSIRKLKKLKDRFKETFPDIEVQMGDTPSCSTMEVSSKNRSVVNRFPVRTYLGKVKNLKYEDVRISWSDISYISEIRMGTSGNYYGTVVLKQKFEGMIDNQVAYTDITTKKMTVILKTYEKYVAGEKHTLWDVFLGDIGVVQTD